MLKELAILVVSSLLKAKGENLSRLAAYVLGPLVVIGVTLSNVSGGIFAVDERPLAITELKTEILPDGTRVPKHGIAVIIEPAPSEYRLPFEAPASRAWTSLGGTAVAANKQRLRIDETGLYALSPLVGITDPVVVVLDAQLGTKVEIPGGTRNVNAFFLESRSGAVFVVYIVIASAFSFGLSLAVGLSALNYKKNTTRKVRAENS